MGQKACEQSLEVGIPLGNSASHRSGSVGAKFARGACKIEAFQDFFGDLEIAVGNMPRKFSDLSNESESERDLILPIFWQLQNPRKALLDRVFQRDPPSILLSHF